MHPFGCDIFHHRRLNSVMHVTGSYNEFSLGLAAFCRFRPKNWTLHWVVPLPRMPITITIITFVVVGNPYKPSLATVKGEQAQSLYLFQPKKIHQQDFRGFQ